MGMVLKGVFPLPPSTPGTPRTLPGLNQFQVFISLHLFGQSIVPEHLFHYRRNPLEVFGNDLFYTINPFFIHFKFLKSERSKHSSQN
ncbi:MAG: hypothetical protein A2169_09295 [Deltaproteobacteria bacterium RBG_13_47_9]|nr:MAG: hypothetical protein A2169_09295 [Deltaproteobacteria bacterium RBG_13_47_9]